MYLTIQKFSEETIKLAYMKQVIFLSAFLIGIFSYSQDENYNLVNLKMNNDKPHFGLTIGSNGKVLFTSYKVSKNGKVKMNGVDPILTLYVDCTAFLILRLEIYADVSNRQNLSFAPVL